MAATVRIHGVGVPVSKLRPPRVRHAEVTRDALLARLSERDAEIVAIQAPAGYGKSTLAIQWASRSQRPAAWVRVDSSDNDPVVLIGSLAAALSTALPEYSPPELLVSDEPAYSRVVLPSFITSVASLPEPVTLVLDDLQELSNDLGVRVLRSVVEALPAGSQVALLGRNLHALPLALWRGQGRVLDLRADELAFSPAESVEAVAAFHADRDAEQIHHAAHGWPVAVFLMSQATSSPDLADIEDFIESEVVATMPPDLREFVLDTAPLGSVNADLAKQVTGEARAGHFLAEAITTVLLQPVDSGWYVYHPLLQECITTELAQQDPDRLRRVRSAAATWHLHAGHLDQAVALATASGDEENLGVVLWGAARPALLHGRATTVKRWLHLIDPVTIDRIPALGLAAAWSNVTLGEYDHVVRHLRRTLELMPPDWRDNPNRFAFAGHLALLQACTWLEAPSPQDALDAAHAACRLTAADDPVSCLAVLGRGLNKAILGRTGAEDDMVQAIALAQSFEAVVTQVEALALLGLLRLADERVTAGCDAIERACRIHARHDLSQMSSSSGILAIARVALAAQRGRDAEVREAMAVQAALSASVEPLFGWYRPLSSAVLADVAVRIGDNALHTENLRTCEASGLAGSGLVQAWVSLARRHHAATSPLSVLTPAELRVWDLLQTRMTLTEIAGSLYLSRETVKSHTSAIYRKLGVATRRDAQELADTWQ